MKAQNRHYDSVHKKKLHPAAKCSNAKCIVCSVRKVLHIQTRQQMRADSILKKIND
jgi:hypothetical protein